MLKNQVKSKSRSNIKRKLSVIMIILFFAGMLYGSISAGTNADKFAGYVATVDKRAVQTVAETFLGTFGRNMLYLAVLYFAGYCAVGQPIQLLVSVFFGRSVGTVMGLIYKTMLWRGIVYCALLVIPHTLVALTAIVLAGRESLLMSNLFLGGAVERLSGDMSVKTLKLYTLKFLILSGVMMLGGFADALLNFMFSGLFI